MPEVERAPSNPTPDEIRSALLARANKFAELAGLSIATVSDRCSGDCKWLGRVKSGKNFTVDRYQRAMTWLEDNWPEAKT